MREIREIIGDEDIEVFLQKGYLDPVYWIEHVFGYKLSWFHKEWISLIRKNRFLNITSPRGSSKSTVLGIWYPLWLVWYKRNQNILIVSRDLKQATKLMDDWQNAIKENELLKSLMPEDRKTTWSKSEINTTTKCKIFTRALTDSILGVRTNFVLCDEAGTFEDIELFRRVLEPTTDLRKGNMVCIGTARGPTDLLSVLKQNKQYVSRVYKMIKDDGTSLWPEMYSLEDLAKIRERIGESAWQSEYMSNPVAQSDMAIFSSESIASCFEFNMRFTSLNEQNGIRIIGADFAIASGPNADFDAFVVVEKVNGKTVLKHGERHKGLGVSGKAQRLKELFQLHECESIYIDPSHIGAAVKTELRDMGLPVYEAEMHSQARNQLLINLKRMLESKELVIPRDIEDNSTFTFTTGLVEELLGFETEKTAIGTTLLKSKARHDDRALALAIACKGSAMKKECMDFFGI